MITDRYSVYVDISAKIEAWDKPSVIAVANDHDRAMLIPIEVKAAAAQMLPGLMQPQLTLMAVFTYLAVRPEIYQVSSITLDRDYSGQVAERLIVRQLIGLIRRERPRFKASAIRIAQVEGSRADRLAREVYRGLRRPDGAISLADIEGVLWA
jgi:hypothetical protein